MFGLEHRGVNVYTHFVLLRTLLRMRAVALSSESDHDLSQNMQIVKVTLDTLCSMVVSVHGELYM